MDASTRKGLISLVNFLAKTLGPSYEICLQEFSESYEGIIAIANNHISKRQVGDHPTGIALKMLMERKYEYQDSVLNYIGILENGKIVRSSTFFIMHDDKLEGMLCINYDSSKLQEFSDSLLRQFHPDEFLEQNDMLSKNGFANVTLNISTENPIEYFQKDANSLMREILNTCLNKMGKPIESLSPKDKQNLTNLLYEHGFFRIKDSVEFLAKEINCASVSVYRYLKKAKEKQ